MQKTVLQVPLPKSLKVSAEAVALEQGFSSLQEVVRIFLKKLSMRTLRLTFEEPGTIRLSKRAEKRYLKMEEDLKKGKNWYTAKNVDDLMRQLNADSLP
jgi:antitoxin component of RelBE/YafQ-DinJ toxin-antitoxin module